MRTTLSLFAMAFASCAPPTAMTLDFTTNLPCPTVASTQYLGVSMGGDTEAVERSFTEIFDASKCRDGVIGTYTFRPPKNDPQLTVSVRAALAPSGDVEHVCAPGDRLFDPDKCVVARRRVRFTPGHRLEVPIVFHDSCIGRPCTPNETCVSGGLCTSSTVETVDCSVGSTCIVVFDAGVPVGGGGGATGGGGGATGGGGGATGGGGGSVVDAGLVVAPQQVMLNEDGGTAHFTVALSAEPPGPVQVFLTSSAPTEASVPTVLEFTATNWMTPHDVVVTGVDDDVDDGDQPFVITLSGTLGAQALSARVDGTTLDDDTAEIVVSPSGGLVTSEAGGQATFDVWLLTRPLGNVDIALGPTSPEVMLDRALVTFTPTNFAVHQRVTVTGIDDLLVDGDQPWAVGTAPASTFVRNDAYMGLDAPDVAGINVDDDGVGACSVFSPAPGCAGAGLCCLAGAVDAGVGDCGATCAADATHSGLGVQCRSTADCASGTCQVSYTTAACLATPMASLRQACTSSVTCAAPLDTCRTDFIFPFLQTCQCNPLASTCPGGTVCNPTRGQCEAQIRETFAYADYCPAVADGGLGAACSAGEGCCETSSGESCTAPAACAGNLVLGCRTSNDCPSAQFCTYDAPSGPPWPSRARCLNGIDHWEACEVGATGRNCAGGGTCTGSFSEPFPTPVPGYCR